MNTRFHEELEQLKMTILRMTALTERAMENAVKALLTRDAALAQEVIKGDDAINCLEVDVDYGSLRLLALDQPMARDLRSIIGLMRMSIDLEAIADQAVNIAQRAQYLSSRPPLPPVPALERLSDVVLDMLRAAIHAHMTANVDEAVSVCQMDDEADRLNLEVLRTLIDFMLTETPAVERAVQTIITARCLERSGDLCTNLAESVIFMVQGVNIKHHHQCRK